MVTPARNQSAETWTTKRARVGGLARRNAPPERIAEARADLEATRLEEHIRKIVDAAPQLTAAQRERLAPLLHPGGDRAAT